MSVNDVTSNQGIQNTGEMWRKAWDLGMNRLFWDHVRKGVQIGSVFGTAVILPWTIFKQIKQFKVLGFRAMISKIMRKQARCLVLGVGLSLAWMSFRYASWQNKQQKLHDETYYLPEGIQSDFDQVSVIWGGGAFLLTYSLSKQFIFSLGMMSPVIAVGMAQSLIVRSRESK